MSGCGFKTENRRWQSPINQRLSVARRRVRDLTGQRYLGIVQRRFGWSLIEPDCHDEYRKREPVRDITGGAKAFEISRRPWARTMRMEIRPAAHPVFLWKGFLLRPDRFFTLIARVNRWRGT
jgi:hypothetical protein